ncbi:hypothetical protein [Lutimonas sp.]|uniref:hypothetical protein n=1 Tax=Lutimonas sp. TaxID=1872403 RepID=UPI003D9BF04F
MASLFPLRSRLLLLLPLLFFTSSCEMLTEELLECNQKIVPKLPEKGLLQGKVGARYSEIISAYVQNADEETFDFQFSVIGILPEGLNFRSDGRVFEIYGIPLKEGIYDFKVKVKLLDVITGTGDGFCFSKDFSKRSYKIVIEA